MPFPATFAGIECPAKASFSRVHGTSPATGQVEIEGDPLVQMGSLQCIQIGGSFFYGLVVRIEEKYTETDSGSTTVQLVDWRDRLHDKFVFGMFNCEDDKGRFFHIYPDDWLIQKKIYVNREMDKELDFNLAQNEDWFGTYIVFLRNNLVSASSLLNWFANKFDFEWEASNLAQDILDLSRPEGLDWNSGIRAIDGMQEILDKNGLRMCFYGVRKVYITLKGFPDNAFAYGFLNKSFHICDIGASEGSRGEELNTKGRRALIVGDHNKYQLTLIGTPDWNENWDLSFCYDGWTIAAFYAKNGLNENSLVEDMPEDYRDSRKFNGKFRNKLTIKEYMETIAWRTFVLHSRIAVLSVAADKNDVITNIKIQEIEEETLELIGDEVNHTLERIREIYDSNYGAHERKEDEILFKPSDKLVDRSNEQFKVFATEIVVARETADWIESERRFTEMSSGVNLDIEQVVKLDGNECYHVRVLFDRPMVVLPEDNNDLGDIDKYETDIILCILSFDKDIYTWAQGEGGAGIRVREQVKSVSNLYKAYINGEEKSILRLNFLDQLKEEREEKELAGELGDYGVDAVEPASADDIAARIAAQMLFHDTVTKTGHLKFDGSAGFMPDGLVENVNVQWSYTGITEVVNFTNQFLLNDNVSIRLFNFEKNDRDKLTKENLNRVRLEEHAEKLYSKPKVALGAAPGPVLARSTRPTSTRAIGTPASSKACGENDLAKVTVPSGKYIADGGLERGNIIICKGTAG